jgi:hypothetical protein
MSQDAEDGRALRELRDALPYGWWVSIHDCAKRDPHIRLRDAHSVSQVSYHGANVAEAADRCREGLTAYPAMTR